MTDIQEYYEYSKFEPRYTGFWDGVKICEVRWAWIMSELMAEEMDSGKIGLTWVVSKSRGGGVSGCPEKQVAGEAG